MVELAIAGEPRFVLDACELRRSGPSYTIDTVRELQATERPSGSSSSGQDQYAQPAHLARVARAAGAVHARRREPRRRRADADRALAARRIASCLPMPRIDVSATEIRRASPRRDYTDMVPPPWRAILTNTASTEGTPGAEWTSANCNAPSSMVWKT
jgi:nicotinate-nucleotide adenylyltransferase